MSTYKTKDGTDRMLPGIGRTVKGQITTDAVIENPLFEKVESPAPQAPAVAQPTEVITQAAVKEDA